MTTRKRRPKKVSPPADSLLGMFAQLDTALKREKHSPMATSEIPLCPKCRVRPRVYSNGRLYSYCDVCRKIVNHEHYERASHGK